MSRPTWKVGWLYHSLCQSSIHRGLWYHTFSQVSECDTMYIPSEIFWFISDFLGWIFELVNIKFLSCYIPFLGGFKSPLFMNNNYRVYVTYALVFHLINWQMVGCRELYIATILIVRVLVIILVTTISFQWLLCLWRAKY